MEDDRRYQSRARFGIEEIGFEPRREAERRAVRGEWYRRDRRREYDDLDDRDRSISTRDRVLHNILYRLDEIEEWFRGRTTNSPPTDKTRYQSTGAGTHSQYTIPQSQFTIPHSIDESIPASSPWNQSYEQAKTDWTESHKTIESLTESLKEAKEELKQLKENKRDHDLLDRVDNNIEKRLTNLTADIDKKIGEIKDIVPKGATIDDSLRFQERKDSRDIEMERIRLQGIREEREDKRKESFGQKFGDFIDSLGTKIGNAIAATVTEVETGEEFKVPAAHYANQPNLAVAQCPNPECQSNVSFPTNAAQIICPVCRMTFSNPFITPPAQQQQVEKKQVAKPQVNLEQLEQEEELEEGQ